MPPQGANAGLIVKAPPYIGLQEGLVGYWSFDGPDMSQSTNNVWALDRSGNNNNGVLKNMATSSARKAGKIGQALDFDGVDDYINPDDAINTLFNTLTQGTISAWVKWESGTGAIFTRGNSTFISDGQLEFYIDSSENLAIYSTASSFGSRALDASFALSNPTSWHHVVFTNNTSGNKFYVDGKQTTPTYSVGSAATDFFFDDMPSSIHGYEIGGVIDTDDETFNGQIDEVRIYNRALSEQEIKRLYKIGSTFVVNKTRQDTLREGLVGHWSFDGPDMSQSTNNVWAIDRSGNNNNGVLKNMATSSARKIGKIGQALDFDGVDDYVNVPDATSLDVDSFTISTWAKHSTDTFKQWEPIVAKGDSSYRLYLCGDTGTCSGGVLNSFSAAINNGASPQNVGTDVVPQSNRWYHVVLTYDRVNLSMYIDGTFKNSQAVTNAVSNVTYALGIGENTESSGTWNGQIDEVRVYNRALSPDEIKRLYKIGSTFVVNKTRTDTLREGLVGHWSFDGPDMSQSTNNVWALDRSGQGNNGVLKNMATSTARVIGKLGQALDLDGVNDLISISNSASIQSLETKTISAWIYPRSAGEDSFGTIYIGEPGVFKFSLCSNIIPDCTGIENTLTLFYAYDNDNGRWRANANVIKYNQWQHVTVVYNTSSTNALFYINGESISVTTISTPTGNFADDNGHVIGSRLSGSDAFDGQIDEVRVYNRALSADEIKRLYNMGR